MLGGIGFTMSIFTSTLAYEADSLQVISKVCTICASVVSSIAGFIYLSKLKPAFEIVHHPKKQFYFSPQPVAALVEEDEEI